MRVMEWSVGELMTAPTTNKKVSKLEYAHWARGFIFEAMRDQRYGQSFCNRFDIQDNILYYSTSVDDADRYIQENYLE